MLGASNSKDMLRIPLDIEAISAVSLQSSQDQKALQNEFMSSLAGVDERIARVEEMLRTQADQLQANQIKQVGPLYNVSAAPRRRPSPSRYHISTKSTRSEGLGVRVTPYAVAC
ncbi:MAG: hypothetical protein M1839_004749 [Geoglossum umbratile]|nr:MAG: hypothetical protein M1839_004749 [Geoglossum umbratile]